MHEVFEIIGIIAPIIIGYNIAFSLLRELIARWKLPLENRKDIANLEYKIADIYRELDRLQSGEDHES